MATKPERDARPDMTETIVLSLMLALVTIFLGRIKIDLVAKNGCEFPRRPSISVESMSVTVIDIASDSQVKADMEVVFGLVENANMNTTIIYTHLNAMAFHLDKLGMRNDFPIYSNKKLVENITVESFEQQGGDKRTVVVRMKDMTVDVDEYEQLIYNRYGVSYFKFELVGSVGTKDIPCTQQSMRAKSDVLKVMFPLFQWNQTKKIDFQPPKTCNVCFPGDFYCNV